MSLFLRPSPRAFYLLTQTHALVFRQPDESESKAARSVVVAEFLSLDEVDLSGLVSLNHGRPIVGVLGVTSVPSARSPIPEVFLILLSATSPLSPILPGSPLRPARVIAVEFHSLSSSFWDPPNLLHDELDPPYTSNSLQTMQSQAAQQGIDNPCNGMRKYLESGGFFLAEDCAWDISTRMGINESGQSPLDTFDERFVWNATLLAPFLKFRQALPESSRQALDDCHLLMPIIQGFCGSQPVDSWSSGSASPTSLALISRLSWKRAGARFMTRGIDDDGQVANFVETEVILATDGICYSYVQVRGSVPLFWQQPNTGLATLQQKVEITRPPQASQPAFDKHFIELLEQYHSVHAVNLLGHRDAEAMLSHAYSDHMMALQQTLEATPATEKDALDATHRRTVSLTPYDFHAVSKQDGPDAVRYDFQTGLREVVQSMDDYRWTAIDASGEVVESQQGVFRVNCLDCLDRTNFIQEVIFSVTLTHFMDSVGFAPSPTLWHAHRELWADNGDRLSKIYAGTGALNTSATRTGKKTFAGLLSDATKSVGRAYITNFQDKGKQNAIDMLLGMMAGQRAVILFDPIGDSVQTQLLARVGEYSSTRNVTIFSGTWNLNGGPPGERLDKWLFATEPADIYMIAFQEIVQLNAQQILQTDPAKKRMWEEFIMKSFGPKYILYRSEQLVGTALIVVVKSDLTPYIRQVESATKKTGLSGLSGNKGGVGIRFNLFDSTICLMTCHLAAGHSNVAERNADYKTISSGLKFLRGKTIDAHDIVIWAADFNYRIAMSNLDARELAESDQIDLLYSSDQLAQAMDEGEVFSGYKEGSITFRPTYKYDNGTDQYDTSEKARIPAWTDRILFKGSSLRLEEYHRAELYTSDHRPVYALFRATVREVDVRKRDLISSQIMKSIQGGNGKLDEKVGKAIQRSTLENLPSEMTGSTRTPVRSAPKRAATAATPPPLPARPSASDGLEPSSPFTQPASRREAPPVPPRQSTKAPPPIPSRTSKPKSEETTPLVITRTAGNKTITAPWITGTKSTPTTTTSITTTTSTPLSKPPIPSRKPSTGKKPPVPTKPIALRSLSQTTDTAT